MGSLAADQHSFVTSSLPLHRVYINRSPVESPPIAKKLLRSNSCQKQSPTLQDCSVDTAWSSGKENRSILKRVDCSRSKSWDLTRKVNFHQNVAVVVYDRVDGEYVCSQCQQLNLEPKDRRQFVSRTLVARPRRSSKTRSSSIDEHVTSHQNSEPSSDLRSSDTLKSGPGRPLESINNNLAKTIDFQFHEDVAGQLWLRFTVPLGAGVVAGDALVKANVTGNKVRILGTRSVKYDASSPATREDFMTRYSLPMNVDPYAISARMDSAGNLFVEAPVAAAERQFTTGSAEQLQGLVSL